MFSVDPDIITPGLHLSELGVIFMFSTVRTISSELRLNFRA
jgi:hypothetical protein